MLANLAGNMKTMHNHRWVLSGGPGTGKTTTLRVLEELGCTCVPEVAREIIRGRLALGLPPRPSPLEFANAIYEADLRNYDTTAHAQPPVFFDRSLSDSLGMLVEAGAITIEAAKEELQGRPYNQQLFFFPFWEEIYATDEERDQTREDAIAISERTASWHRAMGFELVPVPFATPIARAEFILSMAARASIP